MSQTHRGHPSLLLILDVDERLDSKDLRLEVNRCFNFVGSTLVRTHEAAEGDPENIARVKIKYGNGKYLSSADEGADELWSGTIEHWLYSELYKIGNQIRIFNRRQNEESKQAIDFTWMEVDLENGRLSIMMRCDSNSVVDPKTSENISAVRKAYNEGALGEGVARVVMPAPEAYEEQRRIGLEAKAKREAEEAAKAAEEAAKEAEKQAEAEAEAESKFMESPGLIAAKEEAEAEAAAEAEEAYLDKYVRNRGEGGVRDESWGGMAKAAADEGAEGEATDTAAAAASAEGAEGEAAEQASAEQPEGEGAEGEAKKHDMHVEGTGKDDPKTRYDLPDADFELDYSTMWQVEYADGSKRTFDSSKQDFVVLEAAAAAEGEGENATASEAAAAADAETEGEAPSETATA